MDAPSEVLTTISPQVRDHATNRANFIIGLRDLRFDTRLGLDALRATQDIQLGTDLTLVVAPGLPTGDDGISDVLTRLQGGTGFRSGSLYVFVGADFQARNVSRDDAGGPTGWRDVLWKLDGTGYWSFSETSTLISRVRYAAGSKMDRPFQLTMGGREAVRSYNEDAFPGAKRLVATLEQRPSVSRPEPPPSRILAWPVSSTRARCGRVTYRTGPTLTGRRASGSGSGSGCQRVGRTSFVWI